MSRHDTDIVGFFFGVLFLICAGIAISIRTSGFGLIDDRPNGMWLLGTLFAVAGVAGLVGTVASLQRRRDRSSVIDGEEITRSG